MNQSVNIRFSYTNQPDKESTDGHNKTSQLKPRSITQKINNKKRDEKYEVPNEEHLLTPSRVTTAVRMKTKGNKKASIRMVWKRVL